MIFTDIQKLADALLHCEFFSLLAIDVSKKRFGVALSDNTLTLATPQYVITRTKLNVDMEKIIKTYRQNNCQAFVIGAPITLDNTMGARYQSVLDTAKEIEKLYPNIPIYLQDERFSTQASNEATWLKKSSPKDDIAAAWFLSITISKLKNMIES